SALREGQARWRRLATHGWFVRLGYRWRRAPGFCADWRNLGRAAGLIALGDRSHETEPCRDGNEQEADDLDGPRARAAHSEADPSAVHGGEHVRRERPLLTRALFSHSQLVAESPDSHSKGGAPWLIASSSTYSVAISASSRRRCVRRALRRRS